MSRPTSRRRRRLALMASIRPCLDDERAAILGALVGIMGIQPVRDVDLIRHAYVAPLGEAVPASA